MKRSITILAGALLACIAVACTPAPMAVTLVGRTEPPDALVLQSVRLLLDGEDLGEHAVSAIPKELTLAPATYRIDATIRAPGDGELVREPGMPSLPPGRVPSGADGIPGPTLANCDALVAIGPGRSRIVLTSWATGCTIGVEP